MDSLSFTSGSVLNTSCAGQFQVEACRIRVGECASSGFGFMLTKIFGIESDCTRPVQDSTRLVTKNVLIKTAKRGGWHYFIAQHLFFYDVHENHLTLHPVLTSFLKIQDLFIQLISPLSKINFKWLQQVFIVKIQ